MVDDDICDDTNEKSVVFSDQEKGSRNKRNLGTPMEFPRYELLEEALKGGTLFEKGGCPQSKEQEVEMLPDVDWEELIKCQILELLTQNLSTVFQSAVKRIAECGYSEEIAERVILRSGLYHGGKDAVSNVVDGALALLSREKVFDIVFADLPSLVDYTLLEMVCVLREVKPALTVAEAMWCLLMLDLNLVHACRVEDYHLVELCSQVSPGDSSSASRLSQSKTEVSENIQSNPDKQQLSKPFTPIAQTLQFKVPVVSAAPQEPESKNSHVHQAEKGRGSSTPLPKAEAKSKAAVLEDKSGAGQKALNSKEDLHRRKRIQLEKNCRSCTGKNIKANITAWGSLVLDKKLKSSYSSGATKKSFHSKVNTSVKCNQPLPKDSPCSPSSIAPPMQDNLNEKDMDPLAMECNSSIKAPDDTNISSGVPDYYAGIPYDASPGKYVPLNETDEAVLSLTSRLNTVQKALQGWSDWTNEKVMQATQSLGKDQAELKMFRQEKEDAKKVHQEMHMPEEKTTERIMEMKKALVNTTSMIEKIISRLNTLERDSVGLEKDMEALMLSTSVHAMNANTALAKEQEAVKKCQAVPQNAADEAVLSLTSRFNSVQKALQGWSDWENEKVMQATQSLGKDQAELKMFRQEKEDAEKVHQEMQMLEEKTMERSMEMEKALVNTNSMIEKTNSHLNTLERDSVGLKKDVEALMLSTSVHAMNWNTALAKEQEAVKKEESSSGRGEALN